MNDAIAPHPQKTNKVKEILSRHILADGFDFVMDLEKSHGSWIYDKVTNTEYLDMFSMFASAAIGYNHPYLVENCFTTPLADARDEQEIPPAAH